MTVYHPQADCRGVESTPKNVADLLLKFSNRTPCTYHWRRLKYEFSSEFGFHCAYQLRPQFMYTL